jgi:fibronectin type 3 domain-containing protein
MNNLNRGAKISRVDKHCFQIWIAGIFIGMGFILPWKAYAQWPSAPSGLTVVAPYNGQVNLMWTPLPAATAYGVSKTLVDLSPTETPTPSPTGTWNPTPTDTSTPILSSSYQDFQVTNGRTYLYQVWGLNLATPGTPSAITVSPYSAPQSISTVTISHQYSNALELSWNVPLSTYPIQYYNIYRSALILSPTPTLAGGSTATPTATPTGTWATSTPTDTPTISLTPIPAAEVLTQNPTPIATALTTSFIDQTATSLNAAAVYYLVQAVDSQGNLGATPLWSTIPALPENLAPAIPNLSTTIASQYGYGVNLFWPSPLSSEGVEYYQIYRNATPIATLVPTPSVPTQNYMDSQVPFAPGPGINVNYQIEAVNVYGSTTSNLASTSIYQASMYGNIQVTPNATTQAVTISWSSAQPGSYGLAGYQIYKSQNGLPVLTETPIVSGSPTATATVTPIATLAIPPTSTPSASPVYVDYPVTDANGWTYWVQPYDSLGLGGVMAYATPVSLNLAPTPVATVVASGPIGNNEMSVSWTWNNPGFYSTPAPSAYVIYRNLVNTPTPQAIATVVYPQNTYLDDVTQAMAGTPVAYQVAVVDALGNTSNLSSLSNEVFAQALQVPSAPESIQISQSNSNLIFSWLLNPSSDEVDTYQVFGSAWATMTITPTPLATIIPSSSMQFIQANVTPDTITPEYLLAHNSQGFSTPATLAGILLNPYQVSASIATPTPEVNVSWTIQITPIATPPITSFEILRSTTSGANFVPIATVPVSENSFIDTTAQAGVSNYYRVIAQSAFAGTTFLATSAIYPTITPIPEAAMLTWPTVPQGLTANAGETETTLSWLPDLSGNQVQDYQIYQDGSPTPIVTVLPSPTFSIAINATPGVLSSYQIQAQNSSGESGFSGAVTVLPNPAMTPTIGYTPPPSATPAANNLIWISGLNYNGSINGYNIYQSTDAGFSYEIESASVSEPTSFLSVGSTSGYVNYYQIVAADTGMEAAHNSSPVVSIDSWPNAPQSFTVTGGSASVTLQWSLPYGNVPITNYEVYRSTYAGQLLSSLTPTPVSNPVYIDSAVNTSTAYYYQVVAQDLAGIGTPSPEQGFIPGNAPQLEITPLPNGNQLVWTALASPTPTSGIFSGYAIYRLQQPTPNFYPLGSIIEGMGNTSYTDTSTSDGQTYVYEVAGSSSTGVLGPFSNAVTQLVYPQSVSGLTPISGNQIVQLEWNYPGSQTLTYDIQRKLGTDTSGAFQTIATGITGTSYLDTSVENKTFYEYQVITVDPNGLTATSQAVIALPAEPPIVSNPFVSATSGSNGVSLVWQPANQSGQFDPEIMYPLGGYYILRSTDGGATYQLVGTVSATQTSFLDTSANLLGNSDYTYLIQAFDNPPNNEGVVHVTSYNVVTAYPFQAQTALNLNAIRPFGSPNAQAVGIRFIVTDPGRVVMRVYTLSGVFIKQLINQNYGTGIHWIQWNGTNQSGQLVASGVYLIMTQMANYQSINKIAVIK